MKPSTKRTLHYQRGTIIVLCSFVLMFFAAFLLPSRIALYAVVLLFVFALAGAVIYCRDSSSSIVSQTSGLDPVRWTSSEGWIRCPDVGPDATAHRLATHDTVVSRHD
jgi:hypothetical protein